MSWPVEVAGGDRANVLICDVDTTRDGLALLAEALGQRVLERVAMGDLATHLARTTALDILVLDLRRCPADPDLRDAVIRANRERGRLPSCRLVVLFDVDAMDWVFAELDGPDCVLLCDPGLPEIVTAFAVSAAESRERRKAALYDVAREAESSRIEMLSEEVRRLAVTIERLAGRDGGPVGFVSERKRSYREPSGEEALSGAVAPPTPAEVLALIRARRLRGRFLPEELFADPAWDMLLDLFAARLAGKQVSVSSLCIAAVVPPTTALRWIRQLTDRGIVHRIDDPFDGRRVFLELSDEAAQGLMAWVGAVRGSGGLLVAQTG